MADRSHRWALITARSCTTSAVRSMISIASQWLCAPGLRSVARLDGRVAAVPSGLVWAFGGGLQDLEFKREGTSYLSERIVYG
jgi:hypothetical protein